MDDSGTKTPPPSSRPQIIMGVIVMKQPQFVQGVEHPHKSATACFAGGACARLSPYVLAASVQSRAPRRLKTHTQHPHQKQ